MVGKFVSVLKNIFYSNSEKILLYFILKAFLKILDAFCCCCSLTQSCLTLCDPMGYSTPSFPVFHYLLEFAQTHVH